MTDEPMYVPPKRLPENPEADEIIKEFLRVMEHGTPINWKRWKDVMIKAQKYIDGKCNEKKEIT